MRTIRYMVPALLAVARLASAQDFSALSSCAQNCINNMRVSVGCVPVTDQCICGNSNFENGIRDCANQSCSAEDSAAAVGYASGFCLSATGATTAAPATTPEATNTPPPPTTTAEPETTTTPTAASEPTSASSETSTSETSTSETETSTASAAATETSSAASTTASETTDTSSTSSASKTTSEATSGTAASASESASSTADAAAASPPDSGLSVGAKAGIAVGAGAAVVALIALAIAFCRTRRARRPLPRGTMQISEPLPGSGRLDYETGTQFTTRPPKSAGSKFSQVTELDQNARRYEDMLPRVSPRRMV